MATKENPVSRRQFRLPLVEKEIDGIGMGVLPDGTAYLSARGLARICGVVPSTVLEWEFNPESGNPRDTTVASFLEQQGYNEPFLFQMHPTKNERIYPDTVCAAVLEYYAFVASTSRAAREIALDSFRRCARGGMRLFIYGKLGHVPRGRLLPPPDWQAFHDRLLAHKVPMRFFSVLQELAAMVLACMQAGLSVDAGTMPDISVGQVWGAHWNRSEFDEVFGLRQKVEHYYPHYFPQAQSNPQMIWIYPDAALVPAV